MVIIVGDVKLLFSKAMVANYIASLSKYESL
jgi:hypothetical protein